MANNLAVWREASKRWRDKHPERSRAATRKWYAANAAKSVAKHRETTNKDSRRHLLYETKRRAKLKGIPFDLKFDEISWPNVCPALGTPICYQRGRGPARPDSPSLDRLIPSLGYVSGNVIVVSMLANQIKTYATPEQIQRVADFYMGLVGSEQWPSG